MIEIESLDHEESDVFQALLRAARSAGVAPNRCEITVRAVLEPVTERLTPTAREAFLDALPIDARALALPPERAHRPLSVRGRDVLDLVEMAADVHDEDGARRVVRAVLAALDDVL